MKQNLLKGHPKRACRRKVASSQLKVGNPRTNSALRIM